MKFSVIVPTYNRRDALSHTLPTMFAQEYPANDYEIIVVVDGSTDGTVEFLKSLKPSCNFRVLQQPNRGQGAAKNTGWKVAAGDLVVFLDDDLECDPALLCEHVAAHGGMENRVVIGHIPTSSQSPATLSADFERQRSERYLRRIAVQTQPIWPDDAILFANCSLPRSALIATGGFDEQFERAKIEDFELGLRLWNLGLQFVRRPQAVAHHLCLKSDRDLILIDTEDYGKKSVLLCRKHPDFRCHSEFAAFREGSFWKRLGRESAARIPVSPEWGLRVLCRCAQQLSAIPHFRQVGIRLLEYRRSLMMLRSAVRETGSWNAFRAEFGMELPVLLYHHIGPNQPGTYPGLSISAETFERQVRWLARRGYTGIRPSDWLCWRQRGTTLPEKPVLITFDDAYADIAEHALPVLRRFGFTALVFVVTGRMGGTNEWDEARGSATHRLMSAEQIRHWAAEGIEFGAHCRTHPDLTTLSAAELLREVEGSQKDLATLLGAPVTSIAYPYGLYNEAARDSVQRVFQLAFSVDEGLNHLRTDPYRLRRTGIVASDSLVDLEFRLRWGWSPIHRLRSRLRIRSRLKRAGRYLRLSSEGAWNK